MASPNETLPVAERFVSINGEGLCAGQLSAFIRFAGCDLACSYCDTAWARSADAAAEQLTVEALVDWAFAQQTACITLTGGEPLQQPLFIELVEALLACEDEFPRTIEVETNGAQDIADLVAVREKASDSERPWNHLSITLDCKLPSSGMADAMMPGNLALVGADDAVKFVCGNIDDLRAAKRVIDAQDLTLRTNVLLSPVFGRLEPAAIVDFMKSNAMLRERLQLQLHKVIWPGVEKGV